MKTIVLGSAGQLGRDLCPLLPGEVLPWTRADLELGSARNPLEILKAHRPGLVINCSAYNFVDRAESEPEAAFAVNAWGVRSLALACRELDIPLVHFSTDYVFGLDATRNSPWTEQDAPGPVSVYGLSKLAGEYLVRSLCPRHLVIRTCGLYGVWGSGGKGGNFVETMLRIAGQGKPLRVVADQRCTPSFTADVARTTVELITSGQFGLFHVTNQGDCSWYEFAREIFRVAGISADLTSITSAEFAAPARRPSYSVLANDRLGSIGIRAPRAWQEALGDYLQARNKRAQTAQ